MACADDILAFITKRRGIMTTMLEEIINQGMRLGRKINMKKTKLMRTRNHVFGDVNKFKYWGIVLSSNGYKLCEIIISTNRAQNVTKKIKH